MEFNRIIKLLRKERGITQKQAAEDLGVSQALLSHYEKGIRECGLDFVVRVADYYNVSCDYLLGRSAERNSVSTAASSAALKAIRASDGALITPDGNGTTSGSIKLNVVSGKAVWDTTITDQKDEGRGCSFKDITAGSAVGDAAKLVLMALALMPDAALTGTGIDTTYGGDYFWFNNGAEERLPIRGGRWNDGGGAGLFSLYLDGSRAGSYWYIGGRSAFVELPAES